MSDERLGAQAFLEQLVAGGVRWIFGNPGTTEQTVIDYLQDYPEIDLVLALHEGVAVGAAEGYARASGKVGVVELHAGPGLGNGIGHMYNAYVSHTPLLVYVGQSEHRALYQEPVLSADLVAMAEPVTKWAYEVRTVQEIPQIVRRALKVATTPPYGPVMLSIPIDLTDAPCDAPVFPPSLIPAAVRPDPAAIEAAARIVLRAEHPIVLVGDGVNTSGAHGAVAELARALGAPLVEGAAFETVVDTADPLYAGRLPADPAAAHRFLEGCDVVVAVGTRVLAQVFPEPGPPLGDRQVVHIGLDPWELAKNQPAAVVYADERAAVLELAAAVTAGAAGRTTAWAERRVATEAAVAEARRASRRADAAAWDADPMSPLRAIAELAAALPENAFVVDESMSAYDITSRYLHRRPGTWMRGAGGIGMGMPRAVGVAVAHPDRPVITIVGDGTALYSPTALWTAAHHGLAPITVVLNNRGYRTLKQNTLKGRRPGVDHGFVGTDLTGPEIDFGALATAFGALALHVGRPEEIGPALAEALGSGRPALIDLSVRPDV